VDLRLISLKSLTSGLPRALIANLQATIFGRHRHVAEVSDSAVTLLYISVVVTVFQYATVT